MPGNKGKGKYRQPSDSFTRLWNAAPEFAEPTVASVVTKKRKSRSTRSDLSRAHRRGEFEGVSAAYKGMSNFAQFKEVCLLYDTKKIKVQEIRDLSAAGKIDVTWATVNRYVNGEKHKTKHEEWIVAPGAYKTMDAQPSHEESFDTRMLLGLQEENFMLDVIVSMSRRRKGFTVLDIKRWAKLIIQARRGTAYRESLDKWFIKFQARALRKGVDIDEKMTQQQSSGRALVTEATITEYKDKVVDVMLAELENRHLTLNDQGNADEWWFDINKLLQARVVGVAGEERRNEVPGERSPHVTVFSGAIGYETTPAERSAARDAARAVATGAVPSPSSAARAERRAPLDRGVPRRLHEDARDESDESDGEEEEDEMLDIGVELEEDLYAQGTPTAAAAATAMPESLTDMAHSGDLTDAEYCWLTSLSLDSWDSKWFYLLPVMVIFAAKGGVDPSWLKHVVSDKMMCATTHDGWMDEDTKLRWYKAARAAQGSPLGDLLRRIIFQVDQHYSNETIELSVALEEDGNIGFNTPGHHTAALQHGDQRGGPIQHANRILRKLTRREQCGGKLSKPRLMRLIEIAVAASHTPKIFSRAARRVGWAEDDAGNLVYKPMDSCDKSVLTGWRSEESAAAGAASAAATAGGATATTGAAASARRGTYPGTDAYMGRDDATSRASAQTLREIFRSYVPDSDDEDRESGLRRCEPGKVTTKADWREAKKAKKAAKEAAAKKKLEATYKEYERVRGVIESAAMLPEVTDASKLKDLTVQHLVLFIEMRSTKKPISGKNKAFYIELASSVFGQAHRLALGSVPEGFAAWSALAAVP